MTKNFTLRKREGREDLRNVGVFYFYCGKLNNYVKGQLVSKFM
jgi:hypothetical protein